MSSFPSDCGLDCLLRTLFLHPDMFFVPRDPLCAPMGNVLFLSTGARVPLGFVVNEG